MALPSAAHRCAIARPMPRLAPVTSTTLPSRDPTGAGSHTRCRPAAGERAAVGRPGWWWVRSASMQAWRVHELGEPEAVLRLDNVEAPVAGPGEVEVDVSAASLNFPDVLMCRGEY